MSNIGTKVSYSPTSSIQEFIPINLRIGYAFDLAINDNNSLTLTNDFNKLMVPSDGGRSEKNLFDGMISSFTDRSFSEEMSEITTSVGLEYGYKELFTTRVGYFYEDPTKGNRKFVTMGAGVKFKGGGLDIAYLVPLEENHPLARTFRFTLTYDFAANESL